MKNLNINFLKRTLIACSILVLPSLAQANTESVACSTSVSYLGGNLIYAFSASASQKFKEADLFREIDRVTNSRLLTPELQDALIAHYYSIREQRARVALAGARSQCQSKIDSQVVGHTNYLKRVLRNSGISPSAYSLTYSVLLTYVPGNI